MRVGQKFDYKDDPDPGVYNRVVPMDVVLACESVDSVGGCYWCEVGDPHDECDSEIDDGTAGQVIAWKWKEGDYNWDRLIKSIEYTGFNPDLGAIELNYIDDPVEVTEGHHRLALLRYHYNASWVPVTEYDRSKWRFYDKQGNLIQT